MVATTVRDDIKGLWFLMVCTCMTEIKEYDVKAYVYSMVALVIGHEVEVWT